VDGSGCGDWPEPIGRVTIPVVAERRRHEGRRQPVGRAGGAAAPARVVEVRRGGASTPGRRGRPQRPGRTGEPVYGGQVVGRRLVISGRQVEWCLAADAQVMVLLVVVVDCGRRNGVVLLVTFTLHRCLTVAGLDAIFLHCQRAIHLHREHTMINGNSWQWRQSNSWG